MAVIKMDSKGIGEILNIAKVAELILDVLMRMSKKIANLFKSN